MCMIRVQKMMLYTELVGIGIAEASQPKGSQVADTLQRAQTSHACKMQDALQVSSRAACGSDGISSVTHTPAEWAL